VKKVFCEQFPHGEKKRERKNGEEPARPFCILFFCEDNLWEALMTSYEFEFTLLPLTVSVCERLSILSDFFISE